MDNEARQVLKDNLSIPTEFMTYENKKVITNMEHFLDWIEERVTFRNIYDFTLKIIEVIFDNYINNELVLEYYCRKGLYIDLYKDGVAFMHEGEEVAFYSNIVDNLRFSTVTSIELTGEDMDLIYDYTKILRTRKYSKNK